MVSFLSSVMVCWTEERSVMMVRSMVDYQMVADRTVDWHIVVMEWLIQENNAIRPLVVLPTARCSVVMER